MKIVVVGLALIVANFLYQAFTGQNWAQGFERSFFQVAALGIARLNGIK